MKRFIGDKRFYRMVMAVALPIIIQNAITNFVNLLDNVMVGSVGTEAMTGVSIVNQLFFVFNLTIFGAISAAGIFTDEIVYLLDVLKRSEICGTDIIVLGNISCLAGCFKYCFCAVLRVKICFKQQSEYSLSCFSSRHYQRTVLSIFIEWVCARAQICIIYNIIHYNDYKSQ